MPQVTVKKNDVVLPNGVLYQENDVAFLTESEMERLSDEALDSYVEVIEGEPE